MDSICRDYSRSWNARQKEGPHPLGQNRKQELGPGAERSGGEVASKPRGTNQPPSCHTSIWGLKVPLYTLSPLPATLKMSVVARASPRRPMREGQAACALGPRTECSEPREHQLAAHFSKAAQSPTHPGHRKGQWQGSRVSKEGQGSGEETARQAAQWIHASTKVNTRAKARTAGCCTAVHAKMKTVTNALECELSLSKMSLQLK